MDRWKLSSQVWHDFFHTYKSTSFLITPDAIKPSTFFSTTTYIVESLGAYSSLTFKFYCLIKLFFTLGMTPHLRGTCSLLKACTTHCSVHLTSFWNPSSKRTKLLLMVLVSLVYLESMSLGIFISQSGVSVVSNW